MTTPIEYQLFYLNLHHNIKTRLNAFQHRKSSRLPGSTVIPMHSQRVTRYDTYGEYFDT